MEKILNKATAVFAIVFASAILASNAAAATTIFQIQAAEIAEISTSASGTVSDFDESSITSSVTLHRLNDTVKYKLTLKNTDTIAHTIESISDDNTNSYITYEYDDHTDEVVAAGDSFDLLVTATYTTSVTEASERSQTPNINILIKLAGIPDPEEISVGPNTNDDIMLTIVILAASVTGLIICAIVFFVHRHKKGAKAITIVVAAGSIVALGASATNAIASIENPLSFNASFELMDKVLVSYTTYDGTAISALTTYDEPAAITLPTETGYHISGWTTADGQPFDITSTSLTEDITITPTWEPNEYVFSFNANGGTGDAMESVTCHYGVECSLPDSAYTYTDHEFKGWNTAANGSGTSYAVNENITLPNEGGEIALYAQWKSLLITVVYDKNADDAEGTMATQSIKKGTSTALHASNFSRSGYGFLGWIDSNGNNYGPNELITIPEVPESGEFTLRANWLESSGNIQNYTCSKSMAIGTVKALTDQRDGQTYAVAKLADGNCWMIENLRLDAEVTYGTLEDGTKRNTLLQGARGDFGNNGLPDANPIPLCSDPDTCANNAWRTSKQSQMDPIPGYRGETILYNYASYKEDGWAKTPRYNNDNTHNRTPNAGNVKNENTYSYGNIYNTAAAWARTDTDRFSSSTTTDTSICPKGWRLPGGTNNESTTTAGEAWKLIKAVDNLGKTLTSYPNNFVTSGSIAWGHRGRGTSGSYITNYSSTGYMRSNITVYLVPTSIWGMSGMRTAFVGDSSLEMGTAVRCMVVAK